MLPERRILSLRQLVAKCDQTSCEVASNDSRRQRSGIAAANVMTLRLAQLDVQKHSKSATNMRICMMMTGVEHLRGEVPNDVGQVATPERGNACNRSKFYLKAKSTSTLQRLQMLI